MPDTQDRHRGAVFQVSIPLEWDDLDDCYIVDGIKFTKIVNMIGFFEVFGRRDYEFSGLNDAIFVDVGANIADSALFAASNDKVKQVYAYEPFPDVYKMAEQNIGLNPQLKDKIKLYPYGWFNKNMSLVTGEIDDINLSALNTVVPEFAEVRKPDKVHQATIELKKSSDILRDIINSHPDNPIVLKMDIEGAEYICMNELDKSGLLSKVSALFIEWHLKGYTQITDILDKYGFVWFNEKLGANVGFIRAVRK